MHPELTVYPRWRGEHYALAAALMYAAGLSPLARGTLNYLNTGKTPDRFIPAGAGNTIQCPTHPVNIRFIPAGAGNTDEQGATKVAGMVYPRWRGEHPYINTVWPHFNGLSPLARGTRAAAISLALAPAVYPRWRGEHQNT